MKEAPSRLRYACSFNESRERADQKILRTAAASSPLRSDDKK
jgi:hypothetical protein